MRRFAMGCVLLFAASASAAARLAPAPGDAAGLTALPTRVGGRAVADGAAGFRRQWPGTYFETGFRGTAAFFRVGAGDVILHVMVDDAPIGTLVKPAPGLYRLDDLAPGAHRLRVEVTSESQAAPTAFGGFLAATGTMPVALAAKARRIEFVGDSHTVGYANTSHKQECTTDEVWATTDSSAGLGPRLARHYDADYRIDAISGRGVVRNYNGFAADTLPRAYPFALFDHSARADDAGWRPQVIVIALGTNDFSTALHDGELWKTRDALHADFEATYVRLVQMLRARDPHAFIILWATEKADGEIEAEVSRVVAALRAKGETRLAYVPIDGLAFSACHSHPSLADDAAIADRLAAVIDARHDVWRD
ncbi:SGNH/GDSL hydrolase family protein [Sphingomonas nostoxanthinifaciens]|uniref:SGNH/GDSL hydrolase family protein n=1 Tax=Sphingomonas nostoxanthinifaciens TaxID=2872652 RepID=UPI001CC1FAC2|nr:SGNH/GDSL hydrolase family protein [Sphingomonas nostoxanthinifaciens]UAK23304.1 GDSL family lipase [Sphingomonas nostoxanthinifaciens]